LARRLLHNEAYLKFAYCFDADVDLRKQASVQTALACFTQPASDIEVFADRGGNGVDPSETDGRTSKLLIDARAGMSTTPSELPDAVMADFDLKDWTS
ncbi:MAG: hypothetical protein AAGF46_03295, partial [Pseudomonadota bacterium]